MQLLFLLLPPWNTCMCFCEECWYLIIIIATSLLIGNFTLENRCKIFCVLNVNWINLIIEYRVCEWWIGFITSCLLKYRKLFQPYWFYALACFIFFFFITSWYTIPGKPWPKSSSESEVCWMINKHPWKRIAISYISV